MSETTYIDTTGYWWSVRSGAKPGVVIGECGRHRVYTKSAEECISRIEDHVRMIARRKRTVPNRVT